MTPTEVITTYQRTPQYARWVELYAILEAGSTSVEVLEECQVIQETPEHQAYNEARFAPMRILLSNGLRGLYVGDASEEPECL